MMLRKRDNSVHGGGSFPQSIAVSRPRADGSSESVGEEVAWIRTWVLVRWLRDLGFGFARAFDT